MNVIASRESRVVRRPLAANPVKRGPQLGIRRLATYALRLTVGLFCSVVLLVAGCALPKRDESVFYAHRPRSIVIVPVLNESIEVTAPGVFVSTISAPLAERGYYVFPVFLTDALLRDLGLPEAGLVHQLPPSRFFEYFGADAVLFVTIRDWSTKYLLLYSSVVVDVDYELRDTRTGTLLWERSRTVTQDSGGGGLIEMAVNAAINALLTDYRPLAQQANRFVFQPPDGLPPGPYHPDYLVSEE